MKINLNDIAHVKLTPVGQARWRGRFGITPSSNLTVPLWELMQVFGPGLSMGMSEMYFVDNIIELEQVE
jgi:hypothetical protein